MSDQSSDQLLIAKVQAAGVNALVPGATIIKIPAYLFNNASKEAQEMARRLCHGCGAQLVSEYMCDICSRTLPRSEITFHTAGAMHQAIRDGLNPLKTPGIDISVSAGLGAAFGLDSWRAVPVLASAGDGQHDRLGVVSSLRQSSQPSIKPGSSTVQAVGPPETTPSRSRPSKNRR